MNILIASKDGLSGFSEAIQTVFPKTAIQPFVNLAFSEYAHKSVLLTWTWDEDTNVSQKRYNGGFAFHTNHSKEKVSANEILLRCRDRNQIDMDFRDLKGLLDLERIFMQISERIDAYLSRFWRISSWPFSVGMRKNWLRQNDRVKDSGSTK